MASLTENLNEYLAVYPDASYMIFHSKEQAFSSDPLFVAKADGFPGKVRNEPFANRIIYTIELFNKSENAYHINCDDWSILSIIKYFYCEPRTKIEVKAPDGEVRDVDTDDPLDIESVANLLILIDQYKDCKDWKYYDLRQENRRLTTEIESLKMELKELRDDENQ